MILKSVYDKYIQWKKKKRFMSEWREKNAHNRTEAPSAFNMDHVSVGRYTYGTLNVTDFNQWSEVVVRLKIGSFCSIAGNVQFLLGGNHMMDRLVTYPVDKFILNQPNAANKDSGDIIVEDDVWIGYGCIILAGVHIGRGAIIAAGTVVYEDIPDYAIYGSGHVIKYRFNERIRSLLSQIDYDQLDDAFIKANPAFFTGTMTEELAEALIQKLHADVKE